MNIVYEDGFFISYYSKLKAACQNDEIEYFSKLKCDYERAIYIKKLRIINGDNLSIKRQCDSKSEEQAIILKEKANNAFKNKKWVEAMVLYGKSYILMPCEKNTEVAILLANRSAALFHMEEYDRALEDISRCLHMSYPKEKLFKLYERQAQCYLAKKQYLNAIEAFKETITALDSSAERVDKRNKMEKDAQIMIKMLEKDKCTNKRSNLNAKICNSTKSKYVHDSIIIDYNEKEGRFAKSKEFIPVGEELVREKPYSFALLQKFSMTHCQHCLRRTNVPISCEQCIDVVFCSDECKNEAQRTYHKFECGILPIIWKSGASLNCHMALRIIASKPVDYFLKIVHLIKNDLPYEELKNLLDDDYRRVCFLIRHEKLRSESSFFQYSLMADFLTQCLRSAGYFNKLNSDDDISCVSSLILRNLQFLQFNTHEIFELHMSNNNQKTVFIGGGVYPTLALFNHSCDPSITKYYQGTTVYVHSIKPISSNETIAENYGPLFTQEKRFDRLQKLKDLYWFDCNCTACENEWPLYDNMDNSIIPFRCDAEEKCFSVINIRIKYINDFMVKCDSCGQFTNILKGLKVMQDVEAMKKTARILYETGDVKSAMKKYVDMLKIMHEVLVPPFTDYCECQQNIKDCLAQFGNKYNYLD